MANHTSPIDVVILANDGCYAMVREVKFINNLSYDEHKNKNPGVMLDVFLIR